MRKQRQKRKNNINKQLKIELGGMIMLPVFKNSWFPTVFDDFMNNDMMACATTTAPAVNVKEDENAYTMEVAAPGIKKEFCRVNINEDGNLCVAIENKWEHKEEDKEKKQHYLRREFSYSNYQQNYTLPEDVDKEHISAKVENGVLTVILPKFKKEEVKNTRTIEIS